jgi:hypothetical protein
MISLGIISVDFDYWLDFLLSAYIPEKKSECNKTEYLFVDFKVAYDVVRRDVMYTILTEFGITMKFIRLFKMCLHLK